VKMLLEGFELTKDERESQLYNDFEHFRQNKGETIHEYFVRFTKLINDMINIKMTMPKMRLNSKFVNNMLPEWGRFVTAVKLNRGLKTSNYDQLYAYLKQHEAHAYLSNILPQQLTTQSAYVPPVTHQPQFDDNTQLDSELHLTQGTKLQFKMAGLLFRMFRVDRTEVRGTMPEEQLQLEIGETHSKTMHSPKETIEFRILQRQDAADASSGEWSGFG
ncbi:hypothetical protein Tco_0147145, partial [Tanacetum coccineum]